MSSSSFNILILKLDEFIRKYYTNQLIRGVIYSTGALIVFFLLTSIIEFVGHLGITGRTFLFYAYIGCALFLLIRFILIPIFHLIRIGKVISYEQAAEIIGKHFSDVRDKLINTLQLQRTLEIDPSASELVSASIDQRIQEL